MFRKLCPIVLAGLVVAASMLQTGCKRSDEWISLFDGQTLEGWRASENPGSVSVVDGQIVCEGPRAHLFYVGADSQATFKNFEFKADVKTEPGSNSGIFFHTAYQDEGWPSKGYEVQVNNTHLGEGDYRELKKTGSLYGFRNQYKQLVNDGEWYTMHIIVRGKQVVTKVNDMVVVDYYEQPIPAVDGGEPQEGRLSSGTFALQCHDPHSKVYYKNIMVKPLPDDVEAEPVDVPEVDETYARIIRLGQQNFPLVDLHVHLKGDLTLEKALELSKRNGINYGIAPNCGFGFPIQDDEGIYAFLDSLKGTPFFVGMQAEGREWVTMFSPEAISKFDYVFTDAMTWTNDEGKRMRLWVNEEVEIGDKQKFMDTLVDRIVSVITDEPIDIYVNPTFVPEELQPEYDELWTEARMKRVIDAAVANGVAIEINELYRIPSEKFLRLAKEAGVKFTCGSNNIDANLGRSDYCLEMVDKLGLTWQDMFMPPPDSLKRINRQRPTA